METQGPENTTETWQERVEQASREGDDDKLLELARQLTTHLAEHFEKQQPHK
jgi:hypothetical protein